MATSYLVLHRAAHQLDEIHHYSVTRWGSKQADLYISSLFQTFNLVASGQVVSKPIPAEFEVNGFFTKHKKHFIYWRYLSNQEIGIVTILHEKMHQIDYLGDSFQ
jgi:toxin ParE1/3/4